MVAREQELAVLHRQFDLMLQGQRQMVFIRGEAGIGKTSLLDVTCWHGWALAMQGQPETVLARMQQGVEAGQSEGKR